MSLASLRVLQVNHGYPERYNAGSEVYTRHLAHGLARRGCSVSVFAREEDPFSPDFALREESDGALPVHLVNMPRSHSRWQHAEVDEAFARILSRTRPHFVHFHHLNHLSVGLPSVAARTGAVVVFTVHDFWLACPRGQLVQWRLGGDPWPLCSGQHDATCAEACFGRFHAGDADARRTDLAYWTDWVAARMRSVEQAMASVDRFLCPSETVASALAHRFPEVERRIVRVDYGFPDLRVVPKPPGGPLILGYLGTHVPTKGIDLLIRAFRRLDGDARLLIWGRPRGQETEALRRLASGDFRISWEGEYSNSELSHVLGGVDAIVVPSIWLENSPLVIHEAQQARVCVVTANVGGMAEYVGNEVNGLLFEHRNEASLAAALQRLVNSPGLAQRLGARGYLHDPSGDVVSMSDHVSWMIDLYARLLAEARHVA